VREVREEAGIEVSVERLLTRGPADYPHGRLELQFFLCRLLEGRRTGDSVRGRTTAVTRSPDRTPTPRPPFRWIPLSELDRLEFPPANTAALEALRELARA
jgi:8-oxo-dGTP pyrophosphatase MutT (NUDIX family)